jgi:glycosyltransferase involved in cell wall biosynthesis
MMKSPLVSVIIPLFNHEQFVGKAIASVLNQTLLDLELIVINDGSKDGSEAQVAAFCDPRIRYFAQPNQGAHHALNRGVRLARGKYVSILNSDDMYHQKRLEQCVRICERNPKTGACFSHIAIINARGHLRGAINGASHNSAVSERRLTLRGRNEVLLDLLGGNFLATTSNLFCRRSALIQAGPFKPFRYAHDYDCFLRLCTMTRVHVIRRQLLMYRVHRTNTIKESRAATHFEHAFILARLLCSDSLSSIVRGNKNTYEMMARLFNSLETFQADKVILVMLLYLLAGKKWTGKMELDLIGNPRNPFRKQAIEYLQNPNGRAPLKESIKAAVRRLNERTELKGPVYLFGTGEFSRIVYQNLHKERIQPIGYFDNDPSRVEGIKNGLRIETPRRISGIKVIIASSTTRPIYRQLLKLGYSSRDIIVIR